MNCTGFEEMLREDDRGMSTEWNRHASDCRNCRELLDDWLLISREARNLSAPPARDGFRVQVLNAVEQELTPFREARSGRPLFLAVAAAVLMTLGMVGVWMEIERRPDPLDQWVIRSRALADVERSEREYRASINRLADTIEEYDASNSSPRLAVLQEKLLLLDQAISECELLVEENPYHAGLRAQLLTVYRQKDQTLREVLEARQR